MKLPLVSVSIAASALCGAALFAVAMAAQAPQPAQPATASAQPHRRPHPAPTNLKVLPKDLTGDQVDEIMDRWEAALGAHCSTCHTPDPTNIGPNGKPRLNYADDSKEEKATARQMYAMTEEINVKYVSRIDSSGAPVTCGTCHRGHLGPEPFVAPAEGAHQTSVVPPVGAQPVKTK